MAWRAQRRGGAAGTVELHYYGASGKPTLLCRVGSGRFIDNSDGTVTDTQTGLIWEKNVAGSGCLHCVDDTYTWNTAMTTWPDRLNGRLTDDLNNAGFAGYSDWRLPTLAELRSIVNCSFSSCVDPVFVPSAAFLYWSSTTLANDTSFSWVVNFGFGFVGSGAKFNDNQVRSVRGGP